MEATNRLITAPPDTRASSRHRAAQGSGSWRGLAVAGVVVCRRNRSGTEPALARPRQVQAASTGPGKSDVTVRLGRTADGRPVANADISANTAMSTPVEQPGYRRFRVETAAASPQTLQVSGKVPGATRIERTFNSSVKLWHERKVRGEDKVVTSVVTFTAL